MKIDCWAYGPVEAETVSEALAQNRVISVKPTDDGNFDVREMCDEYYGATLTADQLAEWGKELISLSRRKVVVPQPPTMPISNFWHRNSS